MSTRGMTPEQDHALVRADRACRTSRWTLWSTLLKRVSEPEDIADAVVGFVLHSRLATGQVLIVHGGSPI